MAKIDFYESADVYSDGDIENEILHMADEGFDVTKGKGDEVFPFAVAYHFSPERENILSWYPFKAGTSCLEIGAGCGAITGMLCKKCADVTSVDISKRRCQINYARHKDIDGLHIIAGNIQTLDLGKKFDYVVLNGVFEYALSFIHTNSPYVTMLQLAKSFLKPEGKLFIAIENRLGLKYLNGAAEDHTDNYFIGLNQYDGNNSVRTFSKSELISLIKKGGFKSFRFYYPYPDYKFPSEIFTDNTINNGSYGSPYMNLNKCSFGLYSEGKMSDSLAKEGVMDRFSNSFLVELSPEGECDNTVDYVKINSLRKAEYQLMTLIDSGNAAFKLPLCENANAHILKMESNVNIYPDGIRGIAAQKYGQGLKYPFVKNKSLADIILGCKDDKPVSSNLKLFFDKFKPQERHFYNDDFKRVFGDYAYNAPLPCISPANVDLICDNIFVDEKNTYTVIDNEWVFDFDVPLQFIVWRNLNELYYKHPQLENAEPKQKVFDCFNITEDVCRAFVSWAVYFADEYVGCNYLLKYAHPVNEVSLLDLYNARKAKKMFSSSCYYDRGRGFSEDDKAFATIELDDKGSFNVEFPMPADVRGFRFDVTEGMFLKCCIEAVTGGRLVPDNATETQDGFDVFYTTDPHYTLTDFGNDKVTIRGKIKWFEDSELFESVNRQLRTLGESNADFAARVEEFKTLTAKQQEEITTKATALEIDRRYILNCERMLKGYFNKQVELNLAIEHYQNKLAESRAETEKLLNSRTWRFMTVIWRLKSKLTRGR